MTTEPQQDLDAQSAQTADVRARLEELRLAIREERISYGELAELQDLAQHIGTDDVELLQAAGVPEFAGDVVAVDCVSLVRVDKAWHVYEDTREAWDFYTEWRDFRDCECLLEVHVNRAGATA